MTEAEVLPCAEKLVFDNEAEARNQALVLDWQRGDKLKAYKCRYCGLWHLSSEADDREGSS